MSVPVNYSVKSRGTIAIPKDKLIKYSVLNSALKTHKNLSPEDRHTAITHVLGLETNDDIFTKFVLQIYKLSNTGRFSLTFNDDLDSHIKSGKYDRIPILIVTAGSKKAWPELYDNSNLNAEDVLAIEEMSNREYYAILNAIETSECQSTIDDILPCEITKDTKINVDNKITYNSLYGKCFDNVCLTEAEQKGKIISLNSEIPQVAYVADKYNEKYNKFCFPLMEIVERVAKGNYINPNTNVRFSDRTISQIHDKYRKELAMYRKYLEILQSVYQ